VFGRLRRPRPPASPDDLVTVELGMDTVRNEMIAATLRAWGVRVEVLGSGAGGLAPHYAFAQPHRLLVRRGDLDRVRAVIDGTDDLDIELMPDAEPLDQEIEPAAIDQGGSVT
jgi:hypothetical protein